MRVCDFFLFTQCVCCVTVCDKCVTCCVFLLTPLCVVVLCATVCFCLWRFVMLMLCGMLMMPRHAGEGRHACILLGGGREGEGAAAAAAGYGWGGRKGGDGGCSAVLQGEAAQLQRLKMFLAAGHVLMLRLRVRLNQKRKQAGGRRLPPLVLHDCFVCVWRVSGPLSNMVSPSRLDPACFQACIRCLCLQGPSATPTQPKAQAHVSCIAMLVVFLCSHHTTTSSVHWVLVRLTLLHCSSL